MERNYTIRNNRNQTDPKFVLSILKSQGFNCSKLGRLYGTGAAYFSEHSVQKRNGFRKSEIAFLNAIAKGESTPAPLVLDLALMRRVLKSFNIKRGVAGRCIDRSDNFFGFNGREKRMIKLTAGELILLEQNLGLTRKMITTRMEQIMESDKRVVPVRLPDIFAEPKEEQPQLTTGDRWSGGNDNPADVDEFDDEEVPKNRYTLRLNDEEREFMDEWHWQKRMTINDLVRHLIRRAMKEHPEVFKQKKEG